MRAAAAAATGGPWYWQRRGVDGETITLFAGTGYARFGGVEMPVHDMNLVNTPVAEWDFHGEANRRFIAAARGWVPRLIAEIEACWLQLMSFQTRKEYDVGYEAGSAAAGARVQELGDRAAAARRRVGELERAINTPRADEFLAAVKTGTMP